MPAHGSMSSSLRGAICSRVIRRSSRGDHCKAALERRQDPSLSSPLTAMMNGEPKRAFSRRELGETHELARRELV